MKQIWWSFPHLVKISCCDKITFVKNEVKNDNMFKTLFCLHIRPASITDVVVWLLHLKHREWIHCFTGPDIFTMPIVKLRADSLNQAI